MSAPATISDSLTDAEVLRLLNEAESTINAALEMQTESAISIGSTLSDVKQRLGHGKFEAWVGNRFTFSVRTAQKYMLVSERLGEHREVLARFGTTALYSLAVSAEDVREQVLSDVRNDEIPDDESIRKRIVELTPAPSLDSEAAATRETVLNEGVGLFSGWSARKLGKLIAFLQAAGTREVIERLETLLPEPKKESKKSGQKEGVE